MTQTRAYIINKNNSKFSSSIHLQKQQCINPPPLQSRSTHQKNSSNLTMSRSILDQYYHPNYRSIQTTAYIYKVRASPVLPPPTAPPPTKFLPTAASQGPPAPPPHLRGQSAAARPARPCPPSSCPPPPPLEGRRRRTSEASPMPPGQPVAGPPTPARRRRPSRPARRHPSASPPPPLRRQPAAAPLPARRRPKRAAATTLAGPTPFSLDAGTCRCATATSRSSSWFRMGAGGSLEGAERASGWLSTVWLGCGYLKDVEGIWRMCIFRHRYPQAVGDVFSRFVV
jgi:hypothetical protein